MAALQKVRGQKGKAKIIKLFNQKNQALMIKL